MAKESPDYIPTKQELEEEEWIDGKWSGELQNYLEKFIYLDDKH